MVSSEITPQSNPTRGLTSHFLQIYLYEGQALYRRQNLDWRINYFCSDTVSYNVFVVPTALLFLSHGRAVTWPELDPTKLRRIVA